MQKTVFINSFKVHVFPAEFSVTHSKNRLSKKVCVQWHAREASEEQRCSRAVGML